MLPTLRRALAGTAAVLVLAACSSGTTSAAGQGSSPGADAAFPVTVQHAFGSTTIPRPPQRAATVSWVNADTALALGVVPVGMPRDEYGGNENGSTPWKDAALEAAGAPIGSERAPVQYSEADGVNVAEIAATRPDVILAAYSGLTQEDYDKLSKIAPVVAQPGLAYGTSWQDSTRLIGTALGRSAEAERVVADTEARVRDAAAEHPQLAGTSFLYGNLEPGKPVSIYTATDNRPRFLSALGMTLAPAAEDTSGAFYKEWSPERADELAADVFVTWVPDDATEAALRTDPLLSQIPAVRSGALVADADNTLTLSVSAASALSIPWALDRFLPQLAAAADAADAAA